jgi:hypothetical protein
MFTAIAAATFTWPFEVDADGVLLPPSLDGPPFAERVVFAYERSEEICESTPPPLVPPEASPGAPDADAIAVAAESLAPFALRSKAPTAVTSRSTVASLV